jgi:hypothetical protein
VHGSYVRGFGSLFWIQETNFEAENFRRKKKVCEDSYMIITFLVIHFYRFLKLFKFYFRRTLPKDIYKSDKQV